MLQPGSCICKIEVAAIVTEGERVKVQLVVVPTIDEDDVIEQAMEALVILISAELKL